MTPSGGEPELDNSKSGGRNGQLSIHRAFVSFGFEGMRNSFSCFASASTSEFREAGFLDARLQRSEFNEVVSFASASTSEFREAGFLDARLQRSEFNEVVSFASASTSEFREAGFLDARLQRSEFNEVVSFASASTSEFREAGFLDANQRRSEFKGATLRLRLPAGSRKMDSSAQSCKEADSRQ
ncbi:hypothetical protein BGM21_14450 [Geobacillus thermoleovorans]|nr:hypothetical protein BGM21_14450 [Geobacillus thermoleovorans]